MENWNVYARDHRIKLDRALSEYFRYVDLYWKFRNHRDIRRINLCVIKLDKLKLKLNAIVEKYFFTNVEVRKEVKKAIKWK